MTSMKIVSINEKPNQDINKINDSKWQISGQAAKEIVALIEKQKAAMKSHEDALKAAEKAANAAHKKVWDEIYKKTGASDKHSYSIDTEHMDAGILFLIKKQKQSGGLQGLLEALRDSIED